MTALQGVRVLDLSLHEAGPACAQWLAWFGADVVRVDRPPGPEDVAHLNPLHAANNNNKRSITINMSTERGRELVHRLLPQFDIVVENFAPGVADRLGVGWSQVRKINPAIVYCSIKGFGLSGPHRDHLAFDPVAQAASGAMALTGPADGTPTRIGFVVADNVSGTTALVGVLAAYVERLRTGIGQQVEISMQEAVLSMLRSSLISAELKHDGTTKRTGNRMTPPTNTYRCAPGGPNDWVQITAPSPHLFARVMSVVGRPEIPDDPRTATMQLRVENADYVESPVAEWCLKRTKWEAMDELCANGVPASAIFGLEDLVSDRHLAERGALSKVEFPWGTTHSVVTNPARLESGGVDIVAAPLIGQHTREILAVELSLTDGELDALVDDHII